MESKLFSGKKVVVTGGSKGIGYAIAQRFASEGARVYLLASNTGRLENAAKVINAETGQKAGFCAQDLRTIEGCEAAYMSTLKNMGGADILINSAGATKGGRFLEQPDSEMLDGFDLKFHGAVRLCRLFWPALTAAKGTVINIAGGFARTPDPDYMVGGAVNAALSNFTKALAGQGLRDDVNVNWIHPGLTVTDRMDEILDRRAEMEGKTREEVESEAISNEGLRQLGTPEGVAALVAFLCGPDARHIHGAGITIDGGGSKGYS